MNIRRGEIYLALFLFPHEGTTKTRPVVVLQCDEDNENAYYPFILIAPITTRKVETIYQQDVFLPKGEGGLKEDSKILLGALTAMKKTSLVKRLGIVSDNVLRQVDLKLLRILGLLG